MDIIVNIRGANRPRSPKAVTTPYCMYIEYNKIKFPSAAQPLRMRRKSTLGIALVREAAHGAALNPRQRASHRGSLPVHGGGRGGAAPCAPTLPAEEALLEVVRW